MRKAKRAGGRTTPPNHSPMGRLRPHNTRRSYRPRHPHRFHPGRAAMDRPLVPAAPHGPWPGSPTLYAEGGAAHTPRAHHLGHRGGHPALDALQGTHPRTGTPLPTACCPRGLSCTMSDADTIGHPTRRHTLVAPIPTLAAHRPTPAIRASTRLPTTAPGPHRGTPRTRLHLPATQRPRSPRPHWTSQAGTDNG